jgi:hypothetical protein
MESNAITSQAISSRAIIYALLLPLLIFVAYQGLSVLRASVYPSDIPIFGTSGKVLFDGFMNAHANSYIPGEYEAEYVDGRVLMTCKVGGKYDGYFGYFRMRTTFVAGRPVANAEPEKMYAWLILIGNTSQRFGAAPNAEELYGAIRESGCDPPR